MRTTGSAQQAADQDLEPVPPLVGKDVGGMWLGAAKHSHHPGQGCIGASAHVQRRDGKPCSVDADHRSNAAIQLASSVD